MRGAGESEGNTRQRPFEALTGHQRPRWGLSSAGRGFAHPCDYGRLRGLLRRHQRPQEATLCPMACGRPWGAAHWEAQRISSSWPTATTPPVVPCVCRRLQSSHRRRRDARPPPPKSRPPYCGFAAWCGGTTTSEGAGGEGEGMAPGPRPVEKSACVNRPYDLRGGPLGASGVAPHPVLRLGKKRFPKSDTRTNPGPCAGPTGGRSGPGAWGYRFISVQISLMPGHGPPATRPAGMHGTEEKAHTGPVPMQDGRESGRAGNDGGGRDGAWRCSRRAVCASLPAVFHLVSDSMLPVSLLYIRYIITGFRYAKPYTLPYGKMRVPPG